MVNCRVHGVTCPVEKLEVDQEATITKPLADGSTANIATRFAGSVLEVAVSSGGSTVGGVAEYMASFQPAYEIAAARNSLVAISAS